MKPAQQKKFQKQFLDSMIEVIRKTSVDLPRDVVDAIEKGKKTEAPSSRGDYAMGIICKNIDLAKLKSQPLCQDTGSILFFIHYPQKIDYAVMIQTIKKAVVLATKKGYLRQNSVDSLTGVNDGTNLGPGSPSIHAEPWKKDFFEIKLMLKGGGCENVGAQYALPDTNLGAGRDLSGVKKCILDAIQKAQGKGCGPGVLGVAIGGDRATGYLASKEQLLRKMNDENKNPDLKILEEEIVKEAKTTALNRLPASFFVSVSYMCWAYRRQGAKISSQGEIQKWLY